MATPNKNKYSKGTHISERKFRQLIKWFGLMYALPRTETMFLHSLATW